MAGRIPRAFIDDLIDRADIVEVIGSRVPLKKAGREFKACCPFHGEKTPSFTVSPAKQFFHCFGCGAHGTAVGFLMEMDGMGFVDAIEELATMVGVEVPREGGGPERPAGPDLTELLQEITTFYCEQLKNDRRAIDYLKNRGISGETAARYSLGYAPDAWDSVLKKFGVDDAMRRQLELAGAIKPRDKGDGHYDRLRDRIVFPIRDPRGRVVGFGGRVLDKGEPKYLNSPETPVFHKGRELYGLYELRRARRDIHRLVVVEGYMDVVGLAEHGVDYAVATLGTATTTEHLDRLFRVADKVVFCFDGDRAGRNAAWRALENALPGAKDGRQIGFAFLPDGHDPDSLVRELGVDAFEKRLAEAMPLSEFMLERLGDGLDLETVDGRARLAELAKPLIARVPAGVYRTLLVKSFAAAVGLDDAAFDGFVGPAKSRESVGIPQRRPRHRQGTGRGNLVRQAITLLLHYPAIAAEVATPEVLHDLDRPGVALLIELLDSLRGTPHITTAGILERWREHPSGGHLAKLATVESFVDAQGAAAELGNIMSRLALEERPRERADFLLAEARTRALEPAEKTELRDLLARIEPPPQAGQDR